jgi:hypothetical protein
MVAWFRRFSLALSLAVGGLGAPGCSGSGDDLPRVPVAGTVTLDEQPLADGVIQFGPASGAEGPSIGGGSSIRDGRFSISRESGLVPGKYKVAINAAQPKKREEATKGPVSKGLGLAQELIPAKYNSNTELTAEIPNGGTSSLKYELQSK